MSEEMEPSKSLSGSLSKSLSGSGDTQDGGKRQEHDRLSADRGWLPRNVPMVRTMRTANQPKTRLADLLWTALPRTAKYSARQGT